MDARIAGELRESVAGIIKDVEQQVSITGTASVEKPLMKLAGIADELVKDNLFLTEQIAELKLKIG